MIFLYTLAIIICQCFLLIIPRLPWYLEIYRFRYGGNLMSKPTYLKPAHLLAAVSVTLAASTAAAADSGQMSEARQAQLSNFTYNTQPAQARALVQTQTTRSQTGVVYTAHHSHVSHSSHTSHQSHVSHHSSAY